MIRKLLIAAFLFCIPQLIWSQSDGTPKHKMCLTEYESLVKQFGDTKQTKEIDVETAIQLARIYNTIKFDELTGPSYNAFVDTYIKDISIKCINCWNLENGRTILATQKNMI
ncbi:MAG: hypothetical protein NT150_00975 [Bacteroidetes bacterium]|nr:hypothetical protein [Bacteroidota bacterium]